MSVFPLLSNTQLTEIEQSTRQTHPLFSASFQMIRRVLIHGARQIVTVTRQPEEKYLCGKDMHEIGIIQSNGGGLSLVIEK